MKAIKNQEIRRQEIENRKPSHLPVTATCRPWAVSLKISAESVKKSTLFERSELRRF